MSSYKLTDFNSRDRAEIIRLIFAAAEVPYEDRRFDRKDWPKIKPTTPFNALPMLEIDGKVTLCQGITISRYLARKYNLAGKTDLDQAMADMIVDCTLDTILPILPFVYLERDPNKKAKLKKKYLEETMPACVGKLEELLKKNKGGDGYFVGDGMTWADIGLLVLQNFLELAGEPKALSKYPKLNALHDRVTKQPNIAAYLAKRPTSKM